MPRTGWGHSDRAPAPRLARQTPAEVSDSGLPPWEILNGRVRACPGERWGLPGVATLRGEGASDGGGVAPLGSGGSHPPPVDLAEQCAVTGGRSVCPSCPCTLPVHGLCPRRAQGTSSALGRLFYSRRDLGQQEPEVRTGSTAEMEPCKAQKPCEKHSAREGTLNCCPSRRPAPAESCQGRGGKRGDREDGSLPARAQALPNRCRTRSVAGKSE